MLFHIVLIIFQLQLSSLSFLVLGVSEEDIEHFFRSALHCVELIQMEGTGDTSFWPG